MPIFTLTGGRTITVSSDKLADKIEAFEKFGVSYTPTPAEIAAELRFDNARANAKAIPELATWDEVQALAWIQTNIGNPLTTGRASLPTTLTLTSARAAIVAILNVLDKMLFVLISIARMTIALRDARWKDL